MVVTVLVGGVLEGETGEGAAPPGIVPVATLLSKVPGVAAGMGAVPPVRLPLEGAGAMPPDRLSGRGPRYRTEAHGN